MFLLETFDDLPDGLRTLAGQIDKTNSMLRSSKELVAESYKYFESLADVATDISLAFAVVKMCRSLMKHSATFTEQFKNKQGMIFLLIYDPSIGKIILNPPRIMWVFLKKSTKNLKYSPLRFYRCICFIFK